MTYLAVQTLTGKVLAAFAEANDCHEYVVARRDAIVLPFNSRLFQVPAVGSTYSA